MPTVRRPLRAGRRRRVFGDVDSVVSRENDDRSRVARAQSGPLQRKALLPKNDLDTDARAPPSLTTGLHRLLGTKTMCRSGRPSSAWSLRCPLMFLSSTSTRGQSVFPAGRRVLGKTRRFVTPGRRGESSVTVDLYSPDTYVDGAPHGEFERLAGKRIQCTGRRFLGRRVTGRCCDMPMLFTSPQPIAVFLRGWRAVLEDLDPDRLLACATCCFRWTSKTYRDRKPLAPEFAQRGLLEWQIRSGRSRQRSSIVLLRCRMSSSSMTLLVHCRQVIGRLFGLPEKDSEWLHRLAQ